MNPGEQSPNVTQSYNCSLVPQILVGSRPTLHQGSANLQSGSNGGCRRLGVIVQTVEVLPCIYLLLVFDDICNCLFAQNDRFHSSPWQSQNMCWGFLIFGVEFICHLELQEVRRVLGLNAMNIHEHGCGMLLMNVNDKNSLLLHAMHAMSHPMRLLFFSLWHCTLRSKGEIWHPRLWQAEAWTKRLLEVEMAQRRRAAEMIQGAHRCHLGCSQTKSKTSRDPGESNPLEFRWKKVQTSHCSIQTVCTWHPLVWREFFGTTMFGVSESQIDFEGAKLLFVF